jgi:hypothetical protein
MSVVKKSGDSYIVAGNLDLTTYAQGAIVRYTGIQTGDHTNATFSINLPESELDEASIKSLDEYIARVKDLYEYMIEVENGLEDTRFNNKYSFEDFFRLSSDQTSLLSVILREGCGFGYPSLTFSDWGALEVEFRSDRKNAYHKVFSVELSDECVITVSSNNGGTRIARLNKESLITKYKKTGAVASSSTGEKKEVASETITPVKGRKPLRM